MPELTPELRKQTQELIVECENNSPKTGTRGVGSVLDKVSSTLGTLLAIAEDYGRYKATTDKTGSSAEGYSKVLERVMDLLAQGKVDEAKLIGNEALER